ncbi:acyl carrier protein [Streptomyces olivoreticuli]|uniref:acyl carrier protein n=1 Tax=Streptomyces olivoreticuli TaxID=68246 RepID=UPI0013C2E217|nr:acyl carrier protein [Streptomyces olivoreticuli]
MDIRARVCAIISKQLSVPEGELAPDQHFRALPNVDSMRILQIILETEKAFDIEIDDDATFRLQTIGEFQDLVERLCRQGAAT